MKKSLLSELIPRNVSMCKWEKCSEQNIFVIFQSLCFQESTEAEPKDPVVHISPEGDENYEEIQQR